MAKIRLFYQPPPYGIGTDLNRSGYGIGGGGLVKPLLERASRMPQMVAIGVPCLVITMLCYIPLSKYYKYIFLMIIMYMLFVCAFMDGIDILRVGRERWQLF